MTLTNLITATAAAILAMLYIAELLARRQADARADLLRQHLEDAITVQLDQYEENQRLLKSFDLAINERNAANLRAARAANTVRDLPPMPILRPGTDAAPHPHLVKLSPYSLN